MKQTYDICIYHIHFPVLELHFIIICHGYTDVPAYRTSNKVSLLTFTHKKVFNQSNGLGVITSSKTNYRNQKLPFIISVGGNLSLLNLMDLTIDAQPSLQEVFNFLYAHKYLVTIVRGTLADHDTALMQYEVDTAGSACRCEPTYIELSDRNRGYNVIKIRNTDR